MRVLFVASGNSKNFEIAPFIRAQGESLVKEGINLHYYVIKGKGISGYLSNIKPLRKYILDNKIDIIHAHYTLSAWVALLAFSGLPVIVSFMGSDTYGDYDVKGKRKKSSYFQILSAKLIQPFIQSIIVKSENLKNYIYYNNKVHVIPNGVNFMVFKPMNKEEVRKKLKLNDNSKYILFLGNVLDTRKNFQLLSKAKKLCQTEFEILTPYPVEHNKISYYLNASDVLVLTSYNEGSPNVIKEAMACNIPIVATDVGDVKKVIGNTEGCIITSFDEHELAQNLMAILAQDKRTRGREDIKYLRSDKIAKQLINIYSSFFKK